MKKLILKIFFILFIIPNIIYAYPENINQTTINKNTILPSSSSSPTININSIIGSTEKTLYINPSIKPYTTTFQNSIYSSKSYPQQQIGYKFSASTPVLTPINNNNNNNISPSYQSQFQPMPIQSGPTPVIMQYLPQSQLGGGIQYLQLIPTRPLIVPISPYITQPTGNNNYPSQAILNHYHHQIGRSLIRPLNNNINNNNNNNDPNISGTSTHPLYTQGSLIGGYASNIPNFRYFRPNKGMEMIQGPDNLSLNTDEYIPSPNDSPTLNRITRGRP